MMEHARRRNASWMSSRISQRMPSRRKQGNRPNVCSTTHRYWPQPGAVFGAAPGDDRRDTHRPNLLAILVVVVGTVGIHRVRPSSRAPAATAYWRDVLDQR